MTSDEVEQIRRSAQVPVSLEKPVGDDDESEFGHFLADETAPLPDELAETTLQREALRSILGALSERERMVLELRYGLDGQQPRTLDEVVNFVEEFWDILSEDFTLWDSEGFPLVATPEILNRDLAGTLRVLKVDIPQEVSPGARNVRIGFYPCDLQRGLVYFPDAHLLWAFGEGSSEKNDQSLTSWINYVRSGLAEPLSGSRQVRGSDLGEHVTQMELGIDVALLGGTVIPSVGVGERAGHAFALFVEDAEIELRADVPLGGSLLDPAGRLAIVGGHPVARGIADAQGKLRGGIAALGRRAYGGQVGAGLSGTRDAGPEPEDQRDHRDHRAGTARSVHRPGGGGAVGGCTPRPRGPNCTDSRRLGNTWTRDLKRQPAGVFT
jgi:hypothetical protein